MQPSRLKITKNSAKSSKFYQKNQSKFFKFDTKVKKIPKSPKFEQKNSKNLTKKSTTQTFDQQHKTREETYTIKHNPEDWKQLVKQRTKRNECKNCVKELKPTNFGLSTQLKPLMAVECDLKINREIHVHSPKNHIL
jgi:hypothetical protein